jgi:SAM-dependent methyltransferase
VPGRSRPDTLDLWARRLVHAGSLTTATRLLDIGGGSGVLAAAIHALSGAPCTVADPADAVPAPRPGVSFTSAAADALPFACSAFDAVLFSHVLHHLADPEAALREAARVAAPHARLLVRTATHSDLRALPHARWMPDLLDGILSSSADASRIVAWLSAAGWRYAEITSLRTPQDTEVEDYAEAVAMCAWREWAMCPNGGPDPRDAARAWVMDTFDAAPPISETLITARKPPE